MFLPSPTKMMREWHLQEWNIEFALGDAAYDSESVQKASKQVGILLISPINRRNSAEQKDAYSRVIPVY
jgi:hypothetical protein